MNRNYFNEYKKADPTEFEGDIHLCPFNVFADRYMQRLAEDKFKEVVGNYESTEEGVLYSFKCEVEEYSSLGRDYFKEYNVNIGVKRVDTRFLTEAYDEDVEFTYGTHYKRHVEHSVDIFKDESFDKDIDFIKDNPTLSHDSLWDGIVKLESKLKKIETLTLLTSYWRDKSDFNLPVVKLSCGKVVVVKIIECQLDKDEFYLIANSKESCRCIEVRPIWFHTFKQVDRGMINWRWTHYFTVDWRFVVGSKGVGS